MVYYNNNVSKVEGGDVKEITLDGLIPVTSYSITVRAYQDILGPPSIPLNVTINNDSTSVCTIDGDITCEYNKNILQKYDVLR